MNKLNEAQKLAYIILNEIEDNSQELHLLCLKVSRLALLLNNTKVSQKYLKYANEINDIESFLNSYGLIIQKLVQAVDLKKIYRLEDTAFSSISDTYDNLIRMSWDSKKDPTYEIEQYKKKKYRYSKIKTNMYKYVVNTYYQLGFSENISNIFDEYRYILDNKLPLLLPGAKDKLDSITRNLQSQNMEDWSNAVHLCRKLLQDLADALYPPSDQVLEKAGKIIKLDKNAYINRLVTYIDDNATSDKFKQIANSSLEYIGKRLDAVYKSTNKGSHETIQSIEEAKRYVIYTYLIMGDILSLNEG